MVLIGGSSHSGKSSLAESLAATLGWTHISTDSLARHPGRPWKPAPEQVPDDVAEHYLGLSVDELMTDVLRHYKVNVWPKVETIVASHIEDTPTPGVVLEGSALWPNYVTAIDSDRMAALWLTASEEVFRQRIHNTSKYRSKSPRERAMIDKFLGRTLAYDSQMVELANRHGLSLIEVSQSSLPELADRCLRALSMDHR